MKKQIIQASGDADQARHQQDYPAPAGPAFSGRFFLI